MWCPLWRLWWFNTLTTCPRREASSYQQPATKVSAYSVFKEGTRYLLNSANSAPVLVYGLLRSKLRKSRYLNDPGLVKRYVRIKSFDIKLLSKILTLLLLLGLNRIKLINIIFIFFTFIIIIIIIIIIVITIIMITLMALLVYTSHLMPRYEIFQSSLNKKQNE